MASVDPPTTIRRARPGSWSPAAGSWPPALWAGLTSAVLLVLVFLILVPFRAAGRFPATVADDICQLVASLGAGAAGLAAAFRSAGRVRLGWLFLGAGPTLWGVGQAIWCWYELIRQASVPALSAADPFFLCFPVAAAIGLSVLAWTGDRQEHWRDLLDGCIAACSIFAIVWTTSIQGLIQKGPNSPAVLFIDLAYPVGDIVVLTVAVFSLARASTRTSTLWLVTIGVCGLAVADSIFIFLRAAGVYLTGSMIDAGWVIGFLLLAIAPLWFLSRKPRPATDDQSDSGSAPRLPGRRPENSRSVFAAAMPYLPLVAAATVVVLRRRAAHLPISVAELVLILAVVILLVRQYLTLQDNRRLVAEVAAREEQLQRQAFSDQLTGLANRALFTDRATHALELHRRDMRPAALLFIDLDDFKGVNDTLGHGVGDILLIRVAERLRGAVRPGDTLARFGGDEFAVLVEYPDDPVQLGAHIVEAFRVPFLLPAGHLVARATVGITEVRAEDRTPTLDELFARADIAMYAAKRAGKSQIALYDPSMVLPEAADVLLTPALTRAVADASIGVDYEPVVDLRTGRMIGVEAVASWQHDGEPVEPDHFVKLARRAKLLAPLTDLVLDRACGQLVEWSRLDGAPELQLSVTVPPDLIKDSEFPDRVSATLARHRLSPRRLVLQLSEDALQADPGAATEVTQRLDEAGVGLVLDDFGTGLVSLLSLKHIPLRAVQVDMGRFGHPELNAEASEFVRVLFAIGHSLRLPINAAGVTRREQADLLTALGCRHAQGSLFSPPLPAGRLAGVLSTPPAPHPVTAGGAAAATVAR